VNPGDADDTSVILVVEETFIESTASGEARAVDRPSHGPKIYAACFSTSSDRPQ
jgi:hypothetical protein